MDFIDPIYYIDTSWWINKWTCNINLSWKYFIIENYKCSLQVALSQDEYTKFKPYEDLWDNVQSYHLCFFNQINNYMDVKYRFWVNRLL